LTFVLDNVLVDILVKEARVELPTRLRWSVCCICWGKGVYQGRAPKARNDSHIVVAESTLCSKHRSRWGWESPPTSCSHESLHPDLREVDFLRELSCKDHQSSSRTQCGALAFFAASVLHIPSWCAGKTNSMRLSWGIRTNQLTRQWPSSRRLASSSSRDVM
jgi:hypothetical protein